jgi:dUTP pyrophosphatase
MKEIGVKKLTETALIPTRGSEGAVGYDMYSDEDVTIQPGKRYLVSTGIAFQFPKSIYSDMSYYARIAPRSGLAVKQGIDVFAGVVDPDYTGEVKVCLYNSGDSDFVVSKGDRIAQAIFTPILLPELEEVAELKQTARGADGFGSTGK